MRLPVLAASSVTENCKQKPASWLSMRSGRQHPVDRKLNIISDHISKALKDHPIADEEFRLILEEATKYQVMKGEFRNRAICAHAAVKFEEAQKSA